MERRKERYESEEKGGWRLEGKLFGGILAMKIGWERIMGKKLVFC
jgi:hypothetical protein